MCWKVHGPAETPPGCEDKSVGPALGTWESEGGGLWKGSGSGLHFPEPAGLVEGGGRWETPGSPAGVQRAGFQSAELTD